MSNHRDNLLEAAQLLTAVAYGLDDEDTTDSLLAIAHKIRGNTLMGSLPDRSVMFGLNRLLSDLGSKWAVIGGMAVAVHGHERETSDIDVLIDALPDATKTIDSAYMDRFGFYRGKSRTGGHLVLDHKQGQCEFLPAKEEWQMWAIENATPEMVLGLSVPVIRPEAVIVSKLKATTQNPLREKKDIPDVLSVLLNHKDTLDYGVILMWLTPQEAAKFSKLADANSISIPE